MKNYTLIRFIRGNINRLKKEYGGVVSIYILGGVSTDYETGQKVATHTSYQINRAIVLPSRLSRDAVQSISLISVNKKIVQGGTYDVATRTFIIDRRDVPAITAIGEDDWLVYDNKRYEIKWVDEFEQQTAWVIVARAVTGAPLEQDIPRIHNNFLAIADKATATI